MRMTKRTNEFNPRINTMKTEIKTYTTTSDKIPLRAMKSFGPWICIAVKKTRLQDDDGNWLDEWHVTEEWAYNAEGWSDEIYESGLSASTEDKQNLLKKILRKVFGG